MVLLLEDMTDQILTRLLISIFEIVILVRYLLKIEQIYIYIYNEEFSLSYLLICITSEVRIYVIFWKSDNYVIYFS